MKHLAYSKYFYNLMIDDLPSATIIPQDAKEEETVMNYTEEQIYKILGLENKGVVYSEGIMMAEFNAELGTKARHEVILMNHLEMTIEVHGGVTGDRWKIVGFEV